MNAVSYDPTTDSVYVEVRLGESVGNRINDARGLIVDLDAAGEVVGYDIQHASVHPELIAKALALVPKSKRAA